MTPDDDSTPRTGNRPSGEHSGENVTNFRLDRIEAQNDEQSRKLDKMTILLTRHVERQDSQDRRLVAMESSYARALWTSLVAAIGTLGTLVLSLITHSDKVSPK